MLKNNYGYFKKGSLHTWFQSKVIIKVPKGF
jgi:hypothetical protein